MSSLAAIPAGEYVPTADERIVMYNAPWSHFEIQLAMRGDASAPRMAYLDGALELLSPSNTRNGELVNFADIAKTS